MAGPSGQRPADWVPPQEFGAQDAPQMYGPAPEAEAKPKRRWVPIVGALIAGMLVGAGAMSGNQSESAAPGPAPTVTVTAPAEAGEAAPAEEVTVTVTAEPPAIEQAVIEEPAQEGPATSFGDGTYEVGTEIAPGQYRSEGGDLCYWARLKSFSGELDDIIANDLGGSGTLRVTIRESDVGFETARCGTWEKVG